MELRYATLLCGLGLLAANNTQAVVTLKDGEGNVVNSTTLTAYGAATDFEMEIDVLASLSGSVAKTVNVKRYELNVVTGTQNYFCWGLCYSPRYSGDYPEWVSVDPVAMDPGIEYNGFHAYLRPNGVVGIVGFRYVWYDMANENDSAWVDLYFDAGFVGVAENAGTGSFELYPNPAISQDVTMDYALSSNVQSRTIAVFDMLGSSVLTRTIAAPQGRLILPSGALKPGVYVATLRESDRTLLTRRFTVASR